MYSIGSSSVIIWAFLCLLISFNTAASVVDFPLPVSPVTNTIPLLQYGNSLTIGGKPNSLKFGMVLFKILRAAEICPC